VELALLAFPLTYLLCLTIDFCRVFYFTTACVSAAREGAIFGSLDPAHAADTASIQNAALSDCAVPATVTVDQVTDAQNQACVKVTVKYTFSTITTFPGIPSTIPITRSEQIRIAAVVPN
jgi:hypothetical protein